MMRSLYSGVSGLKTHQTKMDVIGNNIANVNTVAYKSSSVTFSELMYQTTTNATSANADLGTGGVNAKQIGLGVTMGATNVSITTTGATQTTGNPFDLKITGDSFFIVSDGTSNYFTKAGAFYVDSVGNLCMTSTGYNVMGWQVSDETGDILQNTVSPLKVMADKNMFSQPEATELATASGVLDKSDTNLTTESGKILSLSIFDDLGYEYTAKFSVKPVTTSVTTTKNVTNTTSMSQTFPAVIKETVEKAYTYNVVSEDGLKSGKLEDYTLQATTKGKLDAYFKDLPTESTLQITADNCADYDIDSTSDLIGKTIKSTVTETTVFQNVDGANVNTISMDKDTLEALKDAGVYTWDDATSQYNKADGKFVVQEKKDDDGNTTTEYRFYTMGTKDRLDADGNPVIDPATIVQEVDADGNPVFEADGVTPVMTEGTPYQDPAEVYTVIDTDNTKADSLAAFIAAANPKPVTAYTTSEPVTTTSAVAGQYTVELTELIDVAKNKTTMDISSLGDTKTSLVFDTSDGRFSYVGEQGNNTTTLNLSLLGGNFKNVDIDFTAVKNVSNNGTSTVGVKAGNEDGKGAGKLLGALKGISIDANGKIYGSYDNGNTELLGQIAVTEFSNASGLEKVGENLYKTTLNSGEFDGIGKDITGIGGSMSTGVLEMSNVDLSSEFTEMITTQRGFQANSRIITTSDTLLEELINLKR